MNEETWRGFFFSGDYELDSISTDSVISFYSILQKCTFLTFSLRLRSSRTLLTGSLAADGYVKLALLIAAGTERVTVKLMGVSG